MKETRNICHRPMTRRILKYKEDKMPSTALEITENSLVA
jgi:hypothetical protein